MRHLRRNGRRLARRQRQTLERSAQNPVLDWRSHLSGHAGEGHVLRRVPEHQLDRSLNHRPHPQRRSHLLCEAHSREVKVGNLKITFQLEKSFKFQKTEYLKP